MSWRPAAVDAWPVSLSNLMSNGLPMPKRSLPHLFWPHRLPRRLFICPRTIARYASQLETVASYLVTSSGCLCCVFNAQKKFVLTEGYNIFLFTTIIQTDI